jgi:predicted lysophospholipase L1 biosynthesis ABC-type transport system permease subunit
LIQVKARLFSQRQDDIERRDVMTAMDAVIVAAVVAAFVIFGGVLAWVEHQTRDLRAVRSVGDRTGVSRAAR